VPAGPSLQQQSPTPVLIQPAVGPTVSTPTTTEPQPAAPPRP
jgi:hypothetical protein